MPEFDSATDCGGRIASEGGGVTESGALRRAEGDAKSSEGRGYFPYKYHADFIRFLAERPELFEVVTYADLDWGEDDTHTDNYRAEFKRWKQSLRRRRRDPKKIHVFLQHDVDARPERTMRLVAEEARRGVPANIMVFNRRHDRAALRDDGVLVDVDYELDWTMLERLCREQRFVVGYHSNAFERAMFDMQQAEATFEADVEELSRRLPIGFFSPHGGVPGPDGSNNRDVPLSPRMAQRLRWVANGHGPRFKGYYSDGGIRSEKRDPATQDLRAFVRSMKRGYRYRILTHPQYYDTAWKPLKRLRGVDWYEEILEHYGADKGSIWDRVDVPG